MRGVSIYARQIMQLVISYKLRNHTGIHDRMTTNQTSEQRWQTVVDTHQDIELNNDRSDDGSLVSSCLEEAGQADPPPALTVKSLVVIY